MLFGDADPDGVISIVLLKEAIEALGGQIKSVYFPDREKEGYGLNEGALGAFKKFSPALLITLDCGITQRKEVEKAKEMGFEVLIIDHHNPLKFLPKASIIVDPKQRSDPYPFKELAAAGIAYKLCQYLLQSRPGGLLHRAEDSLDLVAIATLADQMLLEDENGPLVSQGIAALKYTKRMGLVVLIKETNFAHNGVGEVRQKIIPPLNSATSINHSNEAFLLLTERDLQKTQWLARVLIERAKERQIEKKRIFLEIQPRVESKPDEKIIFEGDSYWPLVLLGPVASRLTAEYHLPVFLYRKGEKESQAAVRVPPGIDAVKALMACEKHLESYGGHPLAAGFKAKNENLEEFKKCLIKFFEQHDKNSRIS